MSREFLNVLCFGLLASFAAAQRTCTPADEGLFFEIIPSDVNCRSYGICWNGEYSVDFCPEGFRFNPTTQICDCTDNVPCFQDPPRFNCPSTGLHQIQHPDNCYQFIICIAGVPNERSCSPGLFWSSALGRCARRAQSDCIDPGLCPEVDDPNNIIFHPDPEDCQVYFICFEGAPIEFDCGDGFHFDPEFNWCILEEDSDCVPKVVMPDNREIDCPNTTGASLLPHPDDCRFYFICVDGEQAALKRCANTMLFDIDQNRCDVQERATCSTGQFVAQTNFLKMLKPF